MQYLRALAAVAVTVSHTLGDIVYHGGPDLFPWYYVGAAGVDLFFVISGFVMLYTAGDRFGETGSATGFLRRRITRIVPLYWLATAIYCLMQIQKGKWDVVRPGLVAASLFFWPYSDAEGAHLPVYSIGWTLDFEMMFYIVFALGLPFRRAGLPMVTGGLVALVVLGVNLALPQPLRFWAHPVLLDFVIGLGLGLAYRRGLRLTQSQAMAAVLLAVASLIGGALAGFNSVPNVAERFPRFIAWGIPCALLFAGAVLRAGPPDRPRRWGLQLGAASYAIYLLHPLVLIAMRPLLPGFLALMGCPVGGVLYACASLASIWAGAVLLHTKFEKPLTRRLSPNRRHPASPVATSSVYSPAGLD